MPGMTTRQTGWLMRLRDRVRQDEAVLPRERHGLLAGAIAEGLDRSATLGAEKRQAQEGGHRSVSDLSFRRAVLSRMSQDKPMPRVVLNICSYPQTACY
jgi:hypothetical protein